MDNVLAITIPGTAVSLFFKKGYRNKAVSNPRKELTVREVVCTMGLHPSLTNGSR
ncbi:hypothetical protein D3C81_2224870 [compost metagenome]